MIEDYAKIQPEVQKEIQTQLEGFLKDTQKDQQYNLSKIQSHTHNGMDSSPIDPNDLVNSFAYFALQTTLLSSAQVKLLHTTAITLVTSQVPPSLAKNPSSIIVVEGITAKIYYGGTAYTGANALEFRYGSASGTKVTADMDTTFLNQTASVFCSVAGVTTQLITAAGQNIVVCIPTANPGAGNSPIAFTVKYRIVNL